MLFNIEFLNKLYVPTVSYNGDLLQLKKKIKYSSILQFNMFYYFVLLFDHLI